MAKEFQVLHYSVIAPKTITISQAQEYSNLGRKKIKKLIVLGAIEITRPDHEDHGRLVKGKAPLIFRESLDEYLEKGKVNIPKISHA